ncbi:phage holin family protein [Niallia sp. XMNu-256]|uniref:phage holin family protein n=1 Tax=Niallia sp. XMNu-256 TaxID=3082444 RepID=UPI0030D37840
MELDFTVYIRPDSFILVPVLIFLGMYLRQTPNIPVWTHVWIQLTFAVFACLLYFSFEIQSVVQGILVTGTAVIFRDIFENATNGLPLFTKGRKEDD